MVLVLGCFVTVIITHCLPFSDAVPMLGAWLPTFTVAISPMVIAVLPEPFTNAFFSASILFVALTPRTIYSLPYSYSTPPEVLRFISCIAAFTSLSATP